MAKVSNPAKSAQAKHPASRKANNMAIANRFPMPDVTMQPMPRAASTYSDSAYSPVPSPIMAARTNPY